MKIATTSDLHGHLPRTPRCDVLLVAGDLGPANATYHRDPTGRRQWIEQQFLPWCQRQPSDHVVVIAGNHDFTLADDEYPVFDTLDWFHYLEDSGCEIDGIKFWGSPWTPIFFDWAFMEDEENLMDRWAMIPDDIDVLLTHGPPHKMGDVNDRHEYCGCVSLREWRDKQTRLPDLHVFGHIHEGHGQQGDGWANVSYLDQRYRPTGKIKTFELKK